MDPNGETYVSHSLRGRGFDASEDGSGRGTPLVTHWQGGSNQDAIVDPKGVAPTIAFASGTHGGHHQPKVFAFDARQSDVIQYGDKTGPLDTDGHTMAVAFDSKGHGQDAGEIAPTLKSQSSTNGHAAGAHSPAIAFQERGRAEGRRLEIGGDQAYALSAQSGGGARQTKNIAAQNGVRRLTPRECERLMGFADDYTLINYKGKPAADGPRYAALGNSMAVPVIRWIGERIDLVEALIAERASPVCPQCCAALIERGKGVAGERCQSCAAFERKAAP